VAKDEKKTPPGPSCFSMSRTMPYVHGLDYYRLQLFIQFEALATAFPDLGSQFIKNDFDAMPSPAD
jgi:hypothetical protein